VFEAITSNQLLAFDLGGQQIPIDSTLIGCNIASFFHYEVVCRSLKVFWRSLSKQVFLEQHNNDDDDSGQVTACDIQQITADSVQSPDDPECSFRRKAGQSVKGYTVNLTETIAGMRTCWARPSTPLSSVPAGRWINATLMRLITDAWRKSCRLARST